MVAKGNRGFADLIAGEGRQPTSRLPPRTGILGDRENRLASLAAGSSTTRVQELVDPALCRIWTGHNRDYAALDKDVCSDLIDSLRAQGRQEIPAIVRRVHGDPACQFEVICGARRHWSVAWLREHDHPEFRFLVEPREMTDEEAFRIADLENRSRQDLSDYERATDYARAIDRYYEGNQGRMAERLQVTRSWLSRYLELARLPSEVFAAFGSPHTLGISHAAQLAPPLRIPTSRTDIIAVAAELSVEQQRRKAEGVTLLAPSEVTKRLLKLRRSVKRFGKSIEHKDDKGRLVASAAQGRGGAIIIKIPKPDDYSTSELSKEIAKLLSKLAD